jgi:hypothetical protein
MRIDNRPTRSARGHSGFVFLLGVSRFDERTPLPVRALIPEEIGGQGVRGGAHEHHNSCRWP